MGGSLSAGFIFGSLLTGIITMPSTGRLLGVPPVSAKLNDIRGECGRESLSTAFT